MSDQQLGVKGERLLAPGSEEELLEAFHESGWTDGLPIVLPTEERVAHMLTGTSHQPDEIVGKLRATRTRDYWTFTVEQVAVNAVMAGARPEHLPVILALLGSGYTARHSSVSSIGRMVVVNGPIRNEIGMNSGVGALGPYSRTNSAIGRAYGMGSQNLQGGSVPSVSFMGTMGNPFALTNLTFAEAEEGSPWEPYHVQYGHGAGESAVTMFGGVRSLVMVPSLGIQETWREDMLSVCGGLRPGAGVVLLLDPIAAHDMVEKEGFASKLELRQWIADNARIPARRWWTRRRRAALEPLALSGVEPWATYLKADPDDTLPMNLLEDVHVIVVGGQTLGAWATVEGHANKSEYNHFYGETVSIDRWR